jgi:hypothetical protein
MEALVIGKSVKPNFYSNFLIAAFEKLRFEVDDPAWTPKINHKTILTSIVYE